MQWMQCCAKHQDEQLGKPGWFECVAINEDSHSKEL
jgi:hypothetical protein